MLVRYATGNAAGASGATGTAGTSGTSGSEPQAAAAVLMIRPARFGANLETLATNHFHGRAPGNDAGTDTVADAVAARAAAEHAALAAALEAAGVRVHVFDGRAAARAPDELFPNNWLSLHGDGTAVLYPMAAPSRRRERRDDVLPALAALGYRISRIVDLTPHEERGAYLEGTGSLVFDHTTRTAYACRSPRTHDNVLEELGRTLGYEMMPFAAHDTAGRAVYHTNVMLSVGTRFAVVCVAAIGDERERRRVRTRLAESGREIVELTLQQLHAFAGNLLELDGARGPVIALSTTALASLDPEQRRALEAAGELVAADVGTIENHGGGSVRCMLAEVALPHA
jgi:hypothetical protein